MITEKEEKQYVRQIIHTNQGHLSTKVTPDIDGTDEQVVQYGFPLVQSTFVGDYK